MRLGIDFGTTRTVAAKADRGNYPVIGFQAESGDAQFWYPSLIAARGSERVFGWDAQAKHGEAGWVFLRSLKRLLSSVAPETPVSLGDRRIPALELLTGYLSQLRRDLYKRSNLEIAPGEPLESWIAVPANANSNQRFLTLEGFRRAGFRVLGMINEPSAAGIEYAHLYASRSGSGKREYVVVYDLGGGTFDASVISMKDQAHEILANEGIAQLGGDDFDDRLLELVLPHIPNLDELAEPARYYLLEECRQQKEGLHPNTRKIVIDLSCAIEGTGEVVVPADEFYRQCEPLVEETIEAVEKAMAQCRVDSRATWDEVAAVYLVGGASDLPIVGRLMRQRYGRRVRRSPYPYAATAIGLAILADSQGGYTLQERFTRYFGVWREGQSGSRIIFDPIFQKGTPLPAAADPPLVHTHIYHPMHTVGHYRYLECSELNEEGQPSGDLMPWGDIFFPLDPTLREERRFNSARILRTDTLEHQIIQEQYQCDARGMIEVTITNSTAGYRRTYRLQRAPMRPSTS